MATLSGSGSETGLRMPDTTYTPSQERNKKYTVSKTTSVQNVNRIQGERTWNLKKLVRVIQKIGNANAFVSALDKRDVESVNREIYEDLDNAKRDGSHGRLVKQKQLLSVEGSQNDDILDSETPTHGKDQLRVVKAGFGIDDTHNTETSKPRRTAKIRRNVSFDLSTSYDRDDDLNTSEKQTESEIDPYLKVRLDGELPDVRTKRRHSSNIIKQDKTINENKFGLKNDGPSKGEVTHSKVNDGCDVFSREPEMQKLNNVRGNKTKQTKLIRKPDSADIPYLSELKEKISARASLLDDEYTNYDNTEPEGHEEQLIETSVDLNSSSDSEGFSGSEVQKHLSFNEKATLNELESYITRGGPVSAVQYDMQSRNMQGTSKTNMPHYDEQSRDARGTSNINMSQLTHHKQLDTHNDRRVKMESSHSRRDRNTRRDRDTSNIDDSRDDDEDNEWTNANDEFVHRRRVNKNNRRGMMADYDEFEEEVHDKHQRGQNLGHDDFNDGYTRIDEPRGRSQNQNISTRRTRDRSPNRSTKQHRERDVDYNDSMECEFNDSENHRVAVSNVGHRKGEGNNVNYDRGYDTHNNIEINGHNKNVRNMSNDSMNESVITDNDETSPRLRRPNVIVTSASIASTDESDVDKVSSGYERKRERREQRRGDREHRDDVSERSGQSGRSGRSYSAGRNKERKQGSADIHRKYQSQINLSRKDKEGYDSDVNRLERSKSHNFTPTMIRRNRMNESGERPDTLDMDEVNAPLSRASSMANIAELPRRTGESKMPKSKMGSPNDFSPMWHAQSTTRLSSSKGNISFIHSPI